MLTVDVDKRMTVPQLLETEWIKHGAPKAPLSDSKSEIPMPPGGSHCTPTSPPSAPTAVECKVVSTETFVNPSKQEM